MTIRLTPEMQRLVEDKVKSGEYSSAEEMVHAGLIKLLASSAGDDFDEGELDRFVQQGVDELNRGEGADADKVFAEIRRLRYQGSAKQSGE